MTQEQRAAIVYAQYRLRLAVLQLERDPGTDVASPMSAAMRAAIQVCDDAMRPPCERRPAGWLRFLPSILLAAMVRDLVNSREEMRRRLSECRATLKAIVDQLAG